MNAPGGLRRRVPFWIWLPLVLMLCAGVVKLKVMQLEQQGGHAAYYAEVAAREARWRWMDSVVRVNSPSPQRRMIERVEQACRLVDEGKPVTETLDIRDYRDAAKRITGWAAAVEVRDTVLRLESGALSFVYDGLWSDSVRRMAVPLHRHAARFSARISFAPDNGACAPTFLVRDISMTRIDATPPTLEALHAGH